MTGPGLSPGWLACPAGVIRPRTAPARRAGGRTSRIRRPRDRTPLVDHRAPRAGREGRRDYIGHEEARNWPAWLRRTAAGAWCSRPLRSLRDASCSRTPGCAAEAAARNGARRIHGRARRLATGSPAELTVPACVHGRRGGYSSCSAGGASACAGRGPVPRAGLLARGRDAVLVLACAGVAGIALDEAAGMALARAGLEPVATLRKGKSSRSWRHQGVRLGSI